MTDGIFTPEEELSIAQLASRRGFDPARDYLQSLMDADLDENGDGDFSEVVPEVVESFRIGWKEIQRGEGMTFEELKRQVLNDD
jgi:hypothetical protein